MTVKSYLTNSSFEQIEIVDKQNINVKNKLFLTGDPQKAEVRSYLVEINASQISFYSTKSVLYNQKIFVKRGPQYVEVIISRAPFIMINFFILQLSKTFET